VNGVECGIGTLHLKSCIFGDEENVRNVVTTPLVQVPALLGRCPSLSAGDIFQVNHGVGYAALRTDDQPLEINGFLGIRIADLRILGDRGVQNAAALDLTISRCRK
jgi:hypothetical protein